VGSPEAEPSGRAPAVKCATAGTAAEIARTAGQPADGAGRAISRGPDSCVPDTPGAPSAALHVRRLLGAGPADRTGVRDRPAELVECSPVRGVELLRGQRRHEIRPALDGAAQGLV